MNPVVVVKLMCIIGLAAAASEDVTKKIPEKAEELGFTTLIQDFSDYGLIDDLNGPGPFTLLAPTNDAISRVTEEQLADTRDVTEILKFYIIRGGIFVKPLENEFQLTTYSTNFPFARVNLYYQGTATAHLATVQCAPIDLSRIDEKASNGLIQTLNSIMVPPFGDIMTYLNMHEDQFSTLISALEATGADFYLKTPGPFTLFAPTNDAFEKLPAGSLENLMNDLPTLLDILKLHTLRGTWCSAGFVSGDRLTALNVYVTLTKDSNGITVDNAKVIFADGSVTNGVVHHIDQVLLPED